MPVIVVGADTPPGSVIIESLIEPGREVRAFVTDPAVAADLRERGVKVALGDISDESHIEGAALRCFSAVLVGDAARDRRERSFADTPRSVMEAWARAVMRSKVKRVIWVTEESPPHLEISEVAVVRPSTPDLGERVVELDDAQEISSSSPN